MQNDRAWISLQEAGNNEKNHNSNIAKLAIALMRHNVIWQSLIGIRSVIRSNMGSHIMILSRNMTRRITTL